MGEGLRHKYQVYFALFLTYPLNLSYKNNLEQKDTIMHFPLYNYVASNNVHSDKQNPNKNSDWQKYFQTGKKVVVCLLIFISEN